MRWNGDGGQHPRLLIADHQPLFVEALAALLRDRGHVIAARACDADAAAAAIAAGGIDAAIIDIDLGDGGAVALMGALRAQGAMPPVIVTAPGPDHRGLADIVESPAAGLVLKTDPSENLGHCLATVLAGGSWFDRQIIADAQDRAAARAGAASLTRREHDVARLVATGRRNRDIASALGISEGTVKMHLHNVYGKLGLESRTQLAMDERLRA